MIKQNQGACDIYRKVRKAMHYQWDPIGLYKALGDIEMGEYDSYLAGLLNLIKNKASTDEIFEYLWVVETVSIGMPGRREATMDFAKWLHELTHENDTLL